MESVSSCSPGASTTSASAAGVCFPHRTSAFTAHPPAFAKNKHPTIVAENSFKLELMPHARDERRYDTFMFPAGKGRTMWNEDIAGVFQTCPCFLAIGTKGSS